MEKKTAELLPCPLCMGEPEITQTGKMQLTLKCGGCQLEVTNKVLRYSLEWLREKIVENWNKRHFTDQQTAELHSRYRELEGLAEKLELALINSMTIIEMTDNHRTDLNISNSIDRQNDRSHDTLTAYRNFKGKEASNGR